MALSKVLEIDLLTLSSARENWEMSLLRDTERKSLDVEYGKLATVHQAAEFINRRPRIDLLNYKPRPHRLLLQLQRRRERSPEKVSSKRKMING